MNITDERPEDGQLVNLKTSRGQHREARWDRLHDCFWFTDCTHPLQNAVCVPENVVKWEPKDETD